MKKILVIVAIIAATCTAVKAENTTRIGSAHRFDYGAFAGWSQGNTSWYGMGIIDLNGANTNFRTRLTLGIVERPLTQKFKKNNGFNPNAGLEFQYLIGLSDAFYIYPTVGGYYEHFSKKTTHKINNDYGVKAGLGVEIQISSSFGFFAEGDYMRMFVDKDKANRLGGRAGVIFAF